MIEPLEPESPEPAMDESAPLAEPLDCDVDEEAKVRVTWATEVRRRDGEIRSGAVRSIPLDDALATIRQGFGWRAG